MSAFNQRIQPIRDLMKAKGLDAFVLRRNPNLAWAIAGRAHVPTTIDMACFDLIVTKWNKKSLSQTNEKGLKMGYYQPDSPERANNNADNNNVRIGFHYDTDI